LQSQQPASLIVSAAPGGFAAQTSGPTFTTDQLQAAAAAAAAAAIGLPPPSALNHGLLDPSTLTPQQQQLFHQMQLQHQAQHLKKMRQRLPHVSGAELRTLQKQISELQQQQQQQQLQTLRLQQKQEQQAFKYLNKAIKTRPSRTYQTRFIAAKVFKIFISYFHFLTLRKLSRSTSVGRQTNFYIAVSFSTHLQAFSLSCSMTRASYKTCKPSFIRWAVGSNVRVTFTYVLSQIIFACRVARLLLIRTYSWYIMYQINTKSTQW
jgi:hypothetical protein